LRLNTAIYWVRTLLYIACEHCYILRLNTVIYCVWTMLYISSEQCYILCQNSVIYCVWTLLYIASEHCYILCLNTVIYCVWFCVWTLLYIVSEHCYILRLNTVICRVSQEECARLREVVPYVKVYRYNPKHLCPKWNGYGDNGQRKVWSSCGSTHCTCRLKMLPLSALSVVSYDAISADVGHWTSLHKKCAACTAHTQFSLKAALWMVGRLVARCC